MRNLTKLKTAIQATMRDALSKVVRHDNKPSANEKMIANIERVNDPSAGSPTETLLRLLLPLSVRVYKTFRISLPETGNEHSPNNSPGHSIGSSDGRCVQRAGT